MGSQGPASHSCLAPLVQGSEGTVEVSPAGININKKQMDLCGGQLSINQTARPLMANMAQVGLHGDFSHGHLLARLPPLTPHPCPSPPGGPEASASLEIGAVLGAAGPVWPWRCSLEVSTLHLHRCLRAALPAGGCAPAATYSTGSFPNVARVFWNL